MPGYMIVDGQLVGECFQPYFDGYVVEYYLARLRLHFPPLQLSFKFDAVDPGILETAKQMLLESLDSGLTDRNAQRLQWRCFIAVAETLGIDEAVRWLQKERPSLLFSKREPADAYGLVWTGG